MGNPSGVADPALQRGRLMRISTDEAKMVFVLLVRTEYGVGVAPKARKFLEVFFGKSEDFRKMENSFSENA